MKQKSHLLMLLLAALFWGTTFVAQRIGADYVGPFTYLACRSWIAVVFLTPVVHAMDRFHDRRGSDNRRPRSGADRKLLLLAGAATGVSLCAASAAQQYGMAFTTASKAGFITALYVVLVPLISIFFRKRPALRIWLCVALSLLGMYLLCLNRERLRLSVGDAWMLLCALLFAVEIMIVEKLPRPLFPARRCRCCWPSGPRRRLWVSPCPPFCMRASSPAASAIPCRFWGRRT